MKKDKKYKLLVIALLSAVLIICTIFAMNNKKETTTKEEPNVTVTDLPLRVESIPINFNMVNSSGANILEVTYKNNSKEDISRLTLQVKLKDTGEIVQLSCSEAVDAGKESVKFTGKGPASGKVEDVEILKYKISTKSGTYMEYDTESNQYNWS